MQQPPKRAIVFGSFIFSLVNFRKNLLQDLVSNGYEVLAIAPGHDEAVIRELNDIGVNFQSISLSRTGFNPIADLNSIYELRKLFRRFKPTVLITYTIKPVIYGTLAAAVDRNIKTLALITGLGYLDTGERTGVKQLMQALIHSLYRYSLRKLDYIAFQNPDDQQYFHAHHLITAGTKETITAGSGVDLSHYERAPVVSNPVRFLLIARMIRAKGIEQYLDAAEQLKRKYGDSVLIQLVGLLDAENPDAINETRLNKLIEDGIIDFRGFIKDVRKIVSEASVFVLPSYYREGTPRTILEAMAMGKPIITTDNPGCRETVKNGENGFLIPIKNSEALAEAMAKFIDNRALISTMGDASYALATDKYDVRLVNKHLFNFAAL